MITGILLGISLATTLTSLLIITTSNTGILQENLATGAVIGTAQASNYAVVVLIISLTITLFLAITLKKQSGNFEEY
jgi:hypothetical protein